MSYDPNQPPGEYPPPTAYGYQPPEGTNPGGYPPPGPGAGYPGGYPPPGAPPYGGQPSPYGGYPGPMAPATSPWAIASLVLSIASWFGLVVLGAVLGVIFGHIALNEINRSGGHIQGRGYAMAGLIIGYIHLAAGLCVILGFIALAIFSVTVPQSH